MHEQAFNLCFTLETQAQSFPPASIKQHRHLPTGMSLEEGYKEECCWNWCKFSFNNAQDLERHRFLVHLTTIWDAYGSHAGQTPKPFVNIRRSMDLQFYCAIEGCDFSSMDTGLFIVHCGEHQHISFKREVWEVERNSEGATNLYYEYQHQIYPDTHLESSTPPHSVYQPCESVLTQRTDSVALESTIYEPIQESSSITVNRDAQTIKLNVNSEADLPKATDVCMTQEFTMPPASKSTSYSGRSNKRKAKPSQLKESIAALHAEYRKSLMEETMKTLRDPETDLAASSKRKESLTAYFNETMEMLEMLDAASVLCETIWKALMIVIQVRMRACSSTSVT
ncbi:hypothetical protein BJ508DRAFT_308258 [Ascobolus immersus RN42]|uniref:C2H2-type domain-containing protein n=1 Tax=Ascobolus immersus RN42 TaxID=1160509 RepID=A0A3N4I496_ASCIM|nr:hypothetical protein BJ508DRAFT_308258 [Ascobolus immersus RN42]